LRVGVKLDFFNFVGPGQERFPVNLPKNKVKNSNPIPGAVPISVVRARKSKPEGVTYGGSSDVGFITSSNLSSGGGTQQIPIGGSSSSSGGVGGKSTASSTAGPDMSVGINQAPGISQTGSQVVPGGLSGAIDMDEFNDLDPQSFAALEKLLQSDQGREIVEHLELDSTVTAAPVATVSQVVEPTTVVETPLPKPVPEEGTGWDHSYTNTETGRKEGGSSASSSVAGSTVGGTMSPGSSVANSPSNSRGKGGRPSARSRTSNPRVSEGELSGVF